MRIKLISISLLILLNALSFAVTTEDMNIKFTGKKTVAADTLAVDSSALAIEESLSKVTIASSMQFDEWKPRFPEVMCDTYIYELTKAIEKMPDNASLYCDRGGMYLDKGDAISALKDFNKALSLNAQLEKAYYLRARAFFQMNQAERGFKDLEKVLQVNPTNDNAYYNRAVQYTIQGETKKAMDDYDQLLYRYPMSAQLYVKRGQLYEVFRNQEKALADFSKAIDLKSDYAEAYYARGHAYSTGKDYDKAIKDYTRTSELKPDFPEPYFNKGLLCDKLNFRSDALEAYRNYIKYSPPTSSKTIDYARKRIKALQ